MNLGINRKLALAICVAALAALLAPQAALGAGGTYTAIECSPYNRGHDAAQNADAGFDVTAYCADAAHDYSMQINRIGQQTLNQGRSGYWQWSAPPSTAIVGVDIEAKLRNDNGYHARLLMADGSGNQAVSIAQGSGDDAHWTAYHWAGAARPRFVAKLACETNQCAPSDVAKTWVRNISIRLVDYTDPSLVSVGGSLLGGGWLRGPQTLSASASDSGSGLSSLYAAVNGATVGYVGGQCHIIPGSPYATVVAACSTQGEPSFTGSPDTRFSPFHDGSNVLVACAVDFANDRNCRSATVRVDNTPPTLAFANGQDVNDPELIRAPFLDATSGVVGGQISFRAVGSSAWQSLPTRGVGSELEARIDSESYAPGQYEFSATATDAAGNQRISTARQDGSPMILTFPLKTVSHITAHLHPGGGSKVRLPYGARPRVTGRLTDASGNPLAHRTVQVTEHYAPGAVVSRRVLTGTTDRRGRWHAALAAGPTRVVAASYGGNARYISAQQSGGRVVVRSHASFKTSRRRVPEGKAVSFHGQVAHRGARIPGQGKIVELQVRQGANEWNTVEQAIHTDSRGRYRLHYRFGRFYRSDVRYLFRVKVDHEQNWPYHAPVRSRSRKVTVVAQ